MAGKKTLEGKVLTDALQMLKDVSCTLKDLNTAYALDGGTALGAMREGRLLPWDTDMDIAIDSSDADKISKIIESLILKGYFVKALYFKENDTPFKKGECRIIKIWNKKYRFFKGDVLLDIFIRYSWEGKSYWAIGDRNAGQGLIINSMPLKFHTETTNIVLDNIEHMVPTDKDGFLTYRYGDWKKPVKEWNSYFMDGAIAEKHFGKK